MIALLMLLLLLACTDPSADSVDPSDSEAGETETTATTTPTDTASDIQEFDVSCSSDDTKDYWEQVDAGVIPPAPVTVEVWAHYPDWWIASHDNGGVSDDFQSWMLLDAKLDEQGIIQLACNFGRFSDVGGPDTGFIPDRYVVYVKPL